MNILISVSFFKEFGFIIIPIATTLSSWLNCILLFIFLKKDNLYYFNPTFFYKFIRIVFSSILMGLLYYFLINYFEANLAYEQNLKSVYLIGTVLIGFISYFIISTFTKAFKISDINPKY